MNNYKVLIVDDEEDICEILQYNLSQTGFIADIAHSAEEALYKMKNHYDILLLDIMMDGISGLKLAQLLREEYSNDVPIIFISALDTESDIINGFNKGGDDYISKPFSVKEVIARVKAVINRYQKDKGITINVTNKEKNNPEPLESEKQENTNLFEYKSLQIDTKSKRVYIDSEEIVLTKKEYEILNLLTSNKSKIFSREEILKLVWKDESYVLERTVDVHIARLRKKLQQYGELIINRSGYGYSFNI